MKGDRTTMSSIAGELITERLEFDGDRQGTLEPFFRDNATRWAAALRDAGAEVVMTERVGAHGARFWQEELPLMVAWAFGR
jgi:hypothetical protein